MEPRSTKGHTVKVTHWVRRDVRDAAERKAKATMKKTGKPVYAQRFLSEYATAAKDIECAQTDAEALAIVERLRGKPLSVPGRKCVYDESGFCGACEICCPPGSMGAVKTIQHGDDAAALAAFQKLRGKPLALPAKDGAS